MTVIRWTSEAVEDLEHILAFVAKQNPQGAATIATRIEEALLAIKAWPRACRYDATSGTHEWVIRGLPLLLIYELIALPDNSTQADIIAVFHTSRDPADKQRTKS
jgi:plasmid stabilization system protein ParE